MSRISHLILLKPLKSPLYFKGTQGVLEDESYLFLSGSDRPADYDAIAFACPESGRFAGGIAISEEKGSECQARKPAAP